MRKARVTVYTYDELNDQAKEKVRAWYREMQGECGDYTREVSEFFKYELDEIGYPSDKCYWSLGHCQGDGMAFYGDIDRDAIAKIRNRVLPRTSRARSLTNTFLFNYVTFTISDCNGHYNHHNSMSVNFEANNISEKTYQLLIELRDAIQEDVKDLSRDLERQGYDIIDSMDEDDNVDENIRANDQWEFHEDGELFDSVHETEPTPEAAGQLRLCG